MARKVVQLCSIDEDANHILALCDDGTMWEASWGIPKGENKHKWRWMFIDGVPQENNES